MAGEERADGEIVREAEAAIRRGRGREPISVGPRPRAEDTAPQIAVTAAEEAPRTASLLQSRIEYIIAYYETVFIKR